MEEKLIGFIEESYSEVSNEDGQALIWIPHCWVEDFMEIIDGAYLDEGGLEANLLEHSVFVDMTYVCECEGIDIMKVFKAY